MQTFFAFAALVVILVVFLVFSAVVFYHIGRYSFVGDSSKRFNVAFFITGIIIISAAFVLMIINHLGL